MELAAAIPRFPNNGASLRALQQKPLGELLIDFFNWRIRYVGARPRAVVIDPLASASADRGAKQGIIVPFLEKVRRGDDLTPHLSLQPHTRGFSPNSGVRGAPVEQRGADKDFMLNTMGYHHLHPSVTIEPGGFATRTDEILLAHVTRDAFTVIGLFGHSVFETHPDGSLSPERARSWKAFDEHSTRGAPSGSVVVQGLIATSGHSLQVVFMAQRYARQIIGTDALIDTADFQRDFFEQAGFQPPSKPKFEWLKHHLDLGVLEQKSNAACIFSKGLN
ncbi:hypothetical protein DWF00_23100 [Bosea caraganae]|uniref:Uncharacterized protein n=2 Tax=Bosea caraganae TaxID=2763117 RepID=A0A370L1W0_9HYPH|nr:hypothetical protein DWE98_21165 [Bosea caraganae]RDJ23505.1 hypothetical protein DWF00_23100 [Bosea caraganae]